MEMTNENKAEVLRVVLWLSYILPPVMLANIAHWSHSVLTGRSISYRARVAIFGGSFAIACLVHHICVVWGLAKWEWLLIWFMAYFTEHLLKFFYVEFWDMVKSWVRTSLKESLNYLNKK